MKVSISLLALGLTFSAFGSEFCGKPTRILSTLTETRAVVVSSNRETAAVSLTGNMQTTLLIAFQMGREICFNKQTDGAGVKQVIAIAINDNAY